VIVTAVCVCCIGAAAALVWYFTAGRDDSGKQTASVTTVSPEDAGATGSSTTLSPSGGGTSSTSSLPSGFRPDNLHVGDVSPDDLLPEHFPPRWIARRLPLHRFYR
jgi:hypothetical protein